MLPRWSVVVVTSVVCISCYIGSLF